MSTTRVMTEADLLAIPKDGFKRELVDGEIVVSPAGARHGFVIILIGAAVANFIKEHDLGAVLDSQTGWRLPSGNLRVPDVSFVSWARLPDGLPVGFLEVAPDLAVEVLSPGDVERRVLDKVGEYLTAGVRLVWVIDPATRTAAAYRSFTNVKHVAEHEALDGEDVLPGFRCPLASIMS